MHYRYFCLPLKSCLGNRNRSLPRKDSTPTEPLLALPDLPDLVVYMGGLPWVCVQRSEPVY